MTLTSDQTPQVPLAEMTREDKVTEIMTLVGVAPRDFDRARLNFDSFEPSDIDVRLTSLRAGGVLLQNWRAIRDPGPVPS